MKHIDETQMKYEKSGLSMFGEDQKLIREN